ncbi:T9SS type A sorting domain-containing protein [candidate division KSB1 bacterium]|nr:T9SS type A sorting domain-containing protein [candidate division KSB1 bacterium]
MSTLSEDHITNFELKTPMPMFYCHGTADVLVPYNGGRDGWYSVGETLGYWINHNKCTLSDSIIMPDIDPSDGSTVVKYSYYNSSNKLQILFYRIVNGGHVWPGASDHIIGNNNFDFNINKDMWEFFSNFEIASAVSINKDKLLSDIMLYQSYPNPFNQTTQIKFSITKTLDVSVPIFDINGQLIERLLDTELKAGTHLVVWDASDFASGIYLIVLRANRLFKTTKCILIK